MTQQERLNWIERKAKEAFPEKNVFIEDQGMYAIVNIDNAKARVEMQDFKTMEELFNIDLMAIVIETLKLEMNCV